MAGCDGGTGHRAGHWGGGRTRSISCDRSCTVAAMAATSSPMTTTCMMTRLRSRCASVRGPIAHGAQGYLLDETNVGGTCQTFFTCQPMARSSLHRNAVFTSSTCSVQAPGGMTEGDLVAHTLPSETGWTAEAQTVHIINCILLQAWRMPEG